MINMRIYCSICDESSQKDCDISATVCGHVFHQPCLYKWFEKNPSCPECRRVLKETDVLKKLYFGSAPDSTLDEVSILEIQLTVTKKELEDSKSEVFALRMGYEDLQSDVKELQQQIQQLQKEKSDNLREINQLKAPAIASCHIVSKLVPTQTSESAANECPVNKSVPATRSRSAKSKPETCVRPEDLSATAGGGNNLGENAEKQTVEALKKVTKRKVERGTRNEKVTTRKAAKKTTVAAEMD